jgi:transposase
VFLSSCSSLQEEMMLFVRTLTGDEAHDLSRRLHAATQTKAYLRLKAVELSAQGKRVHEIATLVGRHPNSVRAYLHQFNAGGFAALLPRWGGGAAPKLGALDKDYFEDLLARPPSHFAKLESPAHQWTYPLLQQYLRVYEGRVVCQSTIWYHLRRLKFTAGRAKLSVTSPDPAYAVKRARVEALEKKL